MQILKISLKNLNSLAGSWTIDFQDAAYQQDGLFAITGPTGAGKTTIFDAICLALYGTTPRLKGASEKKTGVSETENEIMSRLTNDCEAVVIFQTAKGLFRAEFSQKRTQKKDAKKPFGETGWKLFELLEGDGTNPYKEQEITPRLPGEYPAKRQEIIGLDYEQFCRTVMLAQGNFEQFLKASPGEKAALLEKITGTQIYTVIGQTVAKKYSDEDHQLELIEAVLKEIKLLTEGEVQQLTQEQKTLPDVLKKQEQQRKQLQEQISWRELLEQHQAKFDTACESKQELDKEIKSFEEQKATLQKDERTLPLGGDHQEVISVQKSAAEATKRVVDTQKLLQKNEDERSGLDKKIIEQQREVSVAQEEWNGMIDPLQRTRELDIRLIELVRALNKAKPEKDSRVKKSKEIKDKIEQLEKETANVTSFNEQLSGIQKRRKEEIGEQTSGDLAIKSQELSPKKSQWEELKRITASLDRLIASRKEGEQQSLNTASALAQLETDKSNLDEECRLLEEQIAHREEQNQRANAIASLEEERKKLQEGVPCPLCGSLEHPLVFDSIADGAEAESVLKTLKNDLKKLHKQRETLAGKKGAGEATLQQSDKRQQDVEQQYKKEMNSQQELLTAMNIPAPLLLEEIETQLRNVNDEYRKIADQIKQATMLDKEIETIQKELGLLKEKQDELSNLRVQQKSAIEEQRLAETEFDEAAKNEKTARDERVAILGDQNPDLVETELKTKLETANNRHQLLKNQLIALDTTLKNARISLVAYREEEGKLNVDAGEKKKLFLEKITAAGFADLNDFEAGRLPDQERKKLQEKATRLTRQQAELQGRIKTIEEALEKEKAKNLTAHSKEELQTQRDDLDNKIKESIAKISGLEIQLKTDLENRKSHAEKSAEYALQATIVKRWDKLNKLIGQGTNTKFTRFVQRLTLATLLKHANVQLNILMPRYQFDLREDKGKDVLDISCIDSDLNNEKRPIDNLSGGEKFLFSLALALGLSQMSAQKMKIGSLFLDEGFGTLDGEILHNAIDALIRFQSSDDANQKMIGFISHIDTLKDRIANKIEVTKMSDGKSSLSGPGVSGG